MTERTGSLSGAAAAFSVTYLVSQSVGVLAFWSALWLLPPFRALFVPQEALSGLYTTLVLADAVLLPITGFLGAFAVVTKRSWTAPLLWFHAGSCVYAGMVALGVWLHDPRLWLGVGLMMPVMTAPVAIAWRASGGVSRLGMTQAGAVAATAMQVLVFWGFFLGVVPLALSMAERELGLTWSPADLTPYRWTGALLLVAASVLGLASAWYMSTRGRGTPLPLQPTCMLVTQGPYAIVRNPMAAAGIAQGLGIGLITCSWSVLVYALIGATLWHLAIRPVEERELVEQFGEPYRHYRAAVRCWWPSFSRYTAPRSDASRTADRS